MADPVDATTSSDTSQRSEPQRICNADEATRALEQGRHFLEAREYERAMRLLRRSYRLQPIPEAALLMQRLRDEISRDSNYCKDCYRFRTNCQCTSTPSAVPSTSANTNATTPSVALDLASFRQYWDRYTQLVQQGLRCLGVADGYMLPLTFLFSAIIVVLLLRLLTGGPLVDIFASGNSSTSYYAFHFSPFMSSIFVTIIANVLIRLSSRAR